MFNKLQINGIKVNIKVEQPVIRLLPHKSWRAELSHRPGFSQPLALHTHNYFLIPREHDRYVVWLFQNTLSVL